MFIYYMTESVKTIHPFFKKYTRFSVAFCDTKFSLVSIQNSKGSNVNDLQNYHNPSDQFSHKFNSYIFN